jgi:hypothetical protein
MVGEKKLGRPRKADLYGSHIKAAEDKIADSLPEFVDNMMRLARGVTVQEEDENGKERVYSKPPCRQSNEYLINRIMGKPTETQEISGLDGEALGTTVIVLPAKRTDGENRSESRPADGIPGADI